MTRPELAVTDGMPPPDDLPRGECFMTTLYAEDGTRAGLLSAEVLDQMTAGSVHAWLDLTGCFAPDPQTSLPVLTGSYTGAVLTINGTNRTVIYRITDYIPRVHGYIAEWPD